MAVGAQDDSGTEILKGFGRQLKLLRERSGLTQAELGRQLGYSEDLISSVELGRRLAQPEFIDKADDVLGAGGMLAALKRSVAGARFPAFFRDFARLEAEAVERYAYDNMVINGLLQTEDYARALFTMRRPLLDEDTIEQRVAARMARREVIDRRPSPLLGFVIEEVVLQRPLGREQVLCGQLRHLLNIGQLRHVEIQVMPTSRSDNAGVAGPFTLLTPKGRQQVAYLEGQGRSTLITDTEEVRAIASRYGIIRAQALTPEESLAFIEKSLGEA
ncbi:helix-turn-helix domain-containing protein [Streptacidiphilus griseoplanus]|uniref:helix-turn-helix domain-containing protein n=1 Tax=Peterkaempfera griseoplana TaxID=66896 RepID=UPI0006E230EA|nr:helix-turn-helix transcriptional regulator [Peterkaempfera griseoplana]